MMMMMMMVSTTESAVMMMMMMTTGQVTKNWAQVITKAMTEVANLFQANASTTTVGGYFQRTKQPLIP